MARNFTFILALLLISANTFAGGSVSRAGSFARPASRTSLGAARVLAPSKMRASAKLPQFRQKSFSLRQLPLQGLPLPSSGSIRGFSTSSGRLIPFGKPVLVEKPESQASAPISAQSKFWEKHLKGIRKAKTVSLLPDSSAVQIVTPKAKTQEDSVRLVFVSDIHNQFLSISRHHPLTTTQPETNTSTEPTDSSDSEAQNTLKQLPSGDILVITGDLTDHGSPDEIAQVRDLFETLIQSKKYNHIVFIAGNHDRVLDPNFRRTLGDREEFLKSLPENVHYLEDSSVMINGINFYGSPWTLKTGKKDAFRADRKSLKEAFNKIPLDTDVILTHMPPYGHGDTVGDFHVGSKALLKRVHAVKQTMKQKVHAFGHNHPGYGATLDQKSASTYFINAATCNLDHEPKNLPIVLDIERNN